MAAGPTPSRGGGGDALPLSMQPVVRAPRTLVASRHRLVLQTKSLYGDQL
jgi:hypothetical protein